MKEISHRFFSAFLAMLLLASTTSWTVGKHYCMGHLMNVSLFAHAEDCGMDMMMDEGETSRGEMENSCCDDEIITVEGQDDLKHSLEDISLGQQLFLAAFAYSYLKVLEFPSVRQLPNEYYPPPLLIKDIQLLDEVFLI